MTDKKPEKKPKSWSECFINIAFVFVMTAALSLTFGFFASCGAYQAGKYIGYIRGSDVRLSHTKYSGVTLTKVEISISGQHHYRHLSPDGRLVGIQYPTQAEALSDTVDYAYRAGWMPKDMEQHYYNEVQKPKGLSI